MVITTNMLSLDWVDFWQKVRRSSGLIKIFNDGHLKRFCHIFNQHNTLLEKGTYRLSQSLSINYK